MALKGNFFNLDLHISVIADIKDIFSRIFPEVKITNWSISGHTWVFNKLAENVKYINQETWRNLNEEKIKSFQEEYDSFLSSFDGFIVSYPISFCLLYEKYNKPIILVNAVRYDMPFCWTYDFRMLDKLNLCLERLNYKNLLYCASNNKGDQEYLLRGTNLNSTLIPSLCFYTQEKCNPQKKEFIFYEDVSLDINISKEILKNKKEIFFGKYQWKDLYQYRGIVHIPYEASTMSIFEHYSANIPLFFPTKKFLKQLILGPERTHEVSHEVGPERTHEVGPERTHEVEKKISFNSAYFKENYPEKLKEALHFPEWIDFWLDRADYYDDNEMKYITYFDSFSQLESILKNIDTDKISLQMKEWNEIRQKQALEKWKSLLSGLKFRKPKLITYNSLPLLADHIIDCEYKGKIKALHIYPNFNIKNIRENDTIFIKADLLLQNIPLLKQINCSFNLITGISDLVVEEKIAQEINNIRNLQKWFGHNLPYSYGKIHPLPIGFSEEEYDEGNQNIVWKIRELLKEQKDIVKEEKLCITYCSPTNSKRKIIEQLKDKDFVVILPKLSFEEYLKEISKYKYVLSPQGNGPDTHRFYEILMMGGIPVVENNVLNNLYSQFPCIMIDDFQNLTLNKLKQKILLENQTTEKLLFSYWEKYVKSEKSEKMDWMLSTQGQINLNSSLGKKMYQLASLPWVKTIVEIGTWNGQGSTVVLGKAILEKNDPKAILISLETNQEKYHEAQKFWEGKTKDKIQLLHGRIVERNELIEWKNRSQKHDKCQEWMEFDLLSMDSCQNILEKIPEKIDLLLLDGGEFTSEVEFNKLKNRSQIIILDDTKTLKNSGPRNEILSHPNEWKVEIDELNDRNGYLIAFYNKIWRKKLLPEKFIGPIYRLADNWKGIIPDNLAEKPINYLEIGTFYGANLLSVNNSYGIHPESKLYCIDPWIDYSEYSEYKGEQDHIYQSFLHNLELLEKDKEKDKEKIKVIRGFSHEKIFFFPDNYFDLIYIDGNHEPEYVLEDAVLCFRKLKDGGYMIFDDYGWGGPDLTQRGIDGFLNGYYKRIKKIGEKNSQFFIQKIKLEEIEEIKYNNNFDEDKYEKECFQQLSKCMNKNKGENNFIVDIGCSYNSWFLRLPFKGLMIDLNSEKIAKIKEKDQEKQYTALAKKITPETVCQILEENNIPKNFYCLNLDIDGYDFPVLVSLLKKFTPQIIITEINEKIPPPVKFCIKYDPNYIWSVNHMYGYSISCLEDIMTIFGYSLESLTMNNAILVKQKQLTLSSNEIKEKIKTFYQEGYLKNKIILPPSWNKDVDHLQNCQTKEEIIEKWKKYFSENLNPNTKKSQKEDLQKCVMDQDYEKYLSEVLK